MSRQTLQSTPLDEDGLIAYLRTQPDIAATYLFGSHAQGRAHPHSDVDVAVLLDEERLPRGRSVFDRRLRLMSGLARFSEREVDVITLNDAPPLLRHQVLLHGRLLYEGNRALRIEFEVRTGKIYNDLKPMYDFFNQDLLEKIRKVGLSGRRRRTREASSPG